MDGEINRWFGESTESDLKFCTTVRANLAKPPNDQKAPLWFLLAVHHENDGIEER